jgi:hypothetical protein
MSVDKFVQGVAFHGELLKQGLNPLDFVSEFRRLLAGAK